MRRSRTASKVLLVLALTGTAARAQTREDRAQALAAVREGNEHLDAGDAAGALERFQRALALVKSPKLHFNFGQALAGIPGREAEAHEEFAKYLEEVPDADGDKRAEANRQMQALRGKIALLSISTDPVGVGISIDGLSRGVAPLRRPLALLPGAHEVRLAKQGLLPISEVITLASGEDRSKDYLFRVTATAATPALAVAPSGAASPRVEPALAPKPATIAGRAAGVVGASGRQGQTPVGSRQRRRLRIAGLVTAGGGIALGAVGVFAYYTGVSKLDHIMHASMNGDQYNESDGNYKTWGDTGIALMIAGGASLATGAVLYWLNRDGRPGSDRATVSLGYLPGGGSILQARGSF